MRLHIYALKANLWTVTKGYIVNKQFQIGLIIVAVIAIFLTSYAVWKKGKSAPAPAAPVIEEVKPAEAAPVVPAAPAK